MRGYYRQNCLKSFGHKKMECKEVMECSICIERLVNPKCLPCSHTFCCSCLEYLRSTHYGRVRLPCPLCRSEFDVPPGGCYSLPTNIYAEALLCMPDEQKSAVVELNVSKEANRRLKSRLVEVKRKLSGAESSESYLRDMQRITQDQLKDAERLIDQEKTAADACRKQLQQLKRNAGKKLRDAHRENDELKSDKNVYRKCVTDAEASLTRVKESHEKLRQQLLQLLQNESGHPRDAERQADFHRNTTENLRQKLQQVIEETKTLSDAKEDICAAQRQMTCKFYCYLQLLLRVDRYCPILSWLNIGLHRAWPRKKEATLIFDIT